MSSTDGSNNCKSCSFPKTNVFDVFRTPPLPAARRRKTVDSVAPNRAAWPNKDMATALAGWESR